MRPKLGALVYNGQQLAGTVDHDLLTRYETFAKRELNASFNRFLAGGGASDP